MAALRDQPRQPIVRAPHERARRLRDLEAARPQRGDRSRRGAVRGHEHVPGGDRRVERGRDADAGRAQARDHRLVVDELAELAARFLARSPLPAVARELDDRSRLGPLAALVT